MNELFGFSLDRDNLYKQVADRIQDLIVSESLHPGDKLPSERDLAEKMGVSRTVVREAIRVLGVRGLVETKSGCGTYVRALESRDISAPMELFFKLKLSPTPFRDVYEVRRMIEVEAAGLAAERGTCADYELMQKTIDELESRARDPDQFVQLDLEFHLALAAATHNAFFEMLLRPITDLWRTVIRMSYQIPGAVQDAVSYHANVLEQVKRRDPISARQAMLEHIRHSQDMVESIHYQDDNQHSEDRIERRTRWRSDV